MGEIYRYTTTKSKVYSHCAVNIPQIYRRGREGEKSPVAAWPISVGTGKEGR